MTHCLSDATDHHRLPTADPVTTGCARPSSARYTIAPTPNCSAIPGAPTALSHVSRAAHTISRTPDAGVVSNVWALSP
jgi:hypothetical protein